MRDAWVQWVGNGVLITEFPLAKPLSHCFDVRITRIVSRILAVKTNKCAFLKMSSRKIQNLFI